MPNPTVNGEYAAENVVERLNARERVLSWKDEDSTGEREEPISADDHYSHAGTQILRQQGITNAIVIDDGAGHRYVVAREILEAPEAYARRRFRRWLSDAPIRVYEEWQATGRRASYPTSSTPGAVSLCSDDRTWVLHKLRKRIEAGGRREFAAWFGAFPWFRYRGQSLARWYLRARISHYRVEPRFHEPIGLPDLLGDLQEHYPQHPSGHPDAAADVDLYTGRVFLKHPAHALIYAADLKLAMEERGVLCSPVAWLGGYADLKDLPGKTGAGRAYLEEGLPITNGDDAEELISDVRRLDRLKLRCADLESRLEDPIILDRRKEQIERRLVEARDAVRNALLELEDMPREHVYGLVLNLVRDRDRLARQKDLAEVLLKIEKTQL